MDRVGAGHQRGVQGRGHLGDRPRSRRTPRARRSSAARCPRHRLSFRVSSAVGSCRTTPSWVTQAPATTSSSKSGTNLPSSARSSAPAGWRRSGRRAGWRGPASATATSLPCPRPDAVADRRPRRAPSPRRCRRSRRPGRRRPSRAASPRPSSRVTSSGAGRPGTAAVVIRTSAAATYGASSSRCRCGAVLGHLARVAAGALERLEVEVDERGAHRADLVGRGGAHVVRLDDGTEPRARWRSPAARRRRRRAPAPRPAGPCRPRS